MAAGWINIVPSLFGTIQWHVRESSALEWRNGGIESSYWINRKMSTLAPPFAKTCPIPIPYRVIGEWDRANCGLRTFSTIFFLFRFAYPCLGRKVTHSYSARCILCLREPFALLRYLSNMNSIPHDDDSWPVVLDHRFSNCAAIHSEPLKELQQSQCKKYFLIYFTPFKSKTCIFSSNDLFLIFLYF